MDVYILCNIKVLVKSYVVDKQEDLINTGEFQDESSWLKPKLTSVK